MPVATTNLCRHHMEREYCHHCSPPKRGHAIHDGHPLNRTRSQVLAERKNAVMGGCCERFANQQGCECLERARPDQPTDPGPASRCPEQCRAIHGRTGSWVYETCGPDSKWVPCPRCSVKVESRSRTLSNIRGNGNKATILLAISQLGEIVGRTALIVAAWQRDPDAFGLAGLEGDLPDARKVDNSLYGPCGLLALGYLIPMGYLQWQMTAKAHAEVRRLRAIALPVEPTPDLVASRPELGRRAP